MVHISRDGDVDRRRALSEHRDNFVLALTAALIPRYAHHSHTDPTAMRPFQGCRNRECMARLALDDRPTAIDPLTDARRHIQPELAQLTALYDRQIAVLDRELVAVATQLAPTLPTVHSIGPLSAAKIAGIAGQISRFPSAPRFAAYAGVATIAAYSGDRRRRRLTRRGNRQLKRTIHTIAVVQRRAFPSTQTYLARNLAKRKSRKEALRALKRQLANFVYRRLHADAALLMMTTR